MAIPSTHRTLALLGLVLVGSAGCYHRGTSEYVGSVRTEEIVETRPVMRGIDLPSAAAPGSRLETQGLPASRIEDLFIGRFPGLDVRRTGGELTMRLRGVEPLVVIDGLEADPSVLTGLQPREVVRIEVLRNTSETALYGSRGSNGVVRITTRR